MNTTEGNHYPNVVSTADQKKICTSSPCYSISNATWWWLSNASNTLYVLPCKWMIEWFPNVSYSFLEKKYTLFMRLGNYHLLRSMISQFCKTWYHVAHHPLTAKSKTSNAIIIYIIYIHMHVYAYIYKTWVNLYCIWRPIMYMIFFTIYCDQGTLLLRQTS